MPLMADCIIEEVIAVAISFTASKTKGIPFSLIVAFVLFQTVSFSI